MKPPQENSRATRLRVRPDLVLIDRPGAGPEQPLTIKDPVSLEYFQLGPREALLLRTLERPQTIRELTDHYRQHCPSECNAESDVLAFCAALRESSLLIDDRLITDREAPRGGEGWLARLASPLAIRLPGVDPTPLLRRLEPLGRLVYSAPFALVLLISAAIVGALLLGQAETIAGELQKLASLADPRYLLSALVAFLLVKSWHELGHAVACRRMGGECHEVGLLLLVFMPCLYCDVSDAWTFRGRWRRAVVALGGVYFEAIFALTAAAAWLALAPGPARTLCLHVAVIASISSLLVNLNPLLRFDGYYLLADVWGVANLHQQSRRALLGGLGGWVRGESRDEHPFDAPRGWLAAYAAASIVYTTLLLAVILWAVHRALSAWSLRPVGDLLVMLALSGVVIGLARGLARSLFVPVGGNRLGAALRGALVAGAAGGGAWGLLAAPLEQSLRSPCRLEAAQDTTLVAPAGGRLVSLASYGKQVEAGDPIARIDDPAHQVRRLELLEQASRLAKETAGLRARATRDASLFSAIAEAETRLREARRQLRSHDERGERRRIAAPFAGRLIRPPAVGPPIDNDAPAGWTGAPLDAENSGCAVEPGDALGAIAGHTLTAIVLLDQADCSLVRIGDPVRVALDRRPGKHLHGRVERIALDTSDEEASPVERSLRGPLEPSGVYRVRVALNEPGDPAPPGSAQPGAIGQARIVTGQETVFQRCRRWVLKTLRFG